MARTYALHYSPNAGDFAIYDPTAAAMMPGHSRLAPACRIRGRKDVTADASKVTCSRCLAAIEKQAAKAEAAAIAEADGPLYPDTAATQRHSIQCFRSAYADAQENVAEARYGTIDHTLTDTERAEAWDQALSNLHDGLSTCRCADAWGDPALTTVAAELLGVPTASTAEKRALWAEPIADDAVLLAAPEPEPAPAAEGLLDTYALPSQIVTIPGSAVQVDITRIARDYIAQHRAIPGTYIQLRCECGHGDVVIDRLASLVTDVEHLVKLIEHTLFDHISPRRIEETKVCAALSVIDLR